MIYCFIQARMGSSRLPGKVLLPICGKSVLQHIIERVRFAKLIDKIIVVTSINPENDVIQDLCKNQNIDFFRGSENDVLNRYQKTIEHFNIKDNDSIVRITADCPLICPNIIDIIISKHGNNDLTTNCIKRTYPDGLDVEVFHADLLKHPDFDKINFFEKEYDSMDFEGFEVLNIKQNKDLSNLRWTLDTQDDFEFINKIYKALYKPGKIFLMGDILEWLAK